VVNFSDLQLHDMEPVYVPVNPHEKAMQRALIQYRNPKNYDLVKEALIQAGRTDLIGFDKKCLIRPRSGMSGGFWGHSGNGKAPGGKDAKGRAGANTGKQSGGKKKTIRNVHHKKQK